MVLLVSAVNALALNPHGNYTTDTSACAMCHKTHTAQSQHLIGFVPSYTGSVTNPNDNYKLCTYCHRAASAAGQSIYDEIDGRIQDGSTTSGSVWATAAGGFEKMPTLEGPESIINDTTDLITTTSRHEVYQPNNTLVSIPGNNQSTNATIELQCVSCHDPHGTTNGRQLLTTYKRLNPDNATWTTVTVTGITIGVTNQGHNETTQANDTISNFCGACHVDYMQDAAGSGSTAGQSGIYSSAYRHRVADQSTSVPVTGASGYNGSKFVLPTSSTGDLVCTTCHSAHGTLSSSVNSGGSSSILRMDERGVCQNCHNKTPNLTKPVVDTAHSNIYAADKTRILVAFSAYMYGANSAASNSVINTSNISVKDNTSNTALTVSSVILEPNSNVGRKILITLQSPMTTGHSITVTINPTVTDTNGNAIDTSGTPARNTWNFTAP